MMNLLNEEDSAQLNNDELDDMINDYQIKYSNNKFELGIQCEPTILLELCDRVNDRLYEDLQH